VAARPRYRAVARRGRIGHALRRANDAVYSAGVADPALVGMGTTLTVLLVEGGDAIIGSVGDSRAYLVRGSGIELLTHDDTWLASVLGNGTARARRPRGRIRCGTSSRVSSAPVSRRDPKC
jgi:serine/threonine protein phosphatase PrpC